ncbi:MAG TPA: M20/M25/M40 family metallo-hydrolase [Bacteroidota bacterium]|nr:M20/M25/M40 family metallo-hydrolase [Bacteroidota bacterium]
MSGDTRMVHGEQALDAALRHALALLHVLVAIPSHSGEEQRSADALARNFADLGCEVGRVGNNVWAELPAATADAPTVMLLSHHDTVRPSATWTREPYTPTVEDGVLYGLGSNDAGAALSAMVACVAALRHARLPFRLLCVAAAEEETAGQGGIVAALPSLGRVDMAIVGEPTGMEAAVAERGLLVLDCTAHGVSGHAARRTGVNAIDIAMRDIAWFTSYQFPRQSELLGPVSMTVTQIHAGTQHNVIPDRCEFVVDIRVTDVYTHEEILEHVRTQVRSDVRPRSMNLRPSAISSTHPLRRAAEALGVPCVSSPTMSDQARLDMPSLKMGPGRSERSHTADEFVTVEEIREGIRIYLELLNTLAMELR